ncbi:helix-turn-helix domain-containing protein [Micromonospora craniellae]|uniref:XRE family transcriptional regulator n=1 Tax=Micromonospora craniellae TaxID=2294034 RepID=A0A372G3P8_9ACTN|nr:helix-turn-helix transcriptional regulator [Micromonospora craniellae]QOC92001.1 helix-turn-helix domain-containing protein [Micromonospora craniellae]RFS47534.1 XRE family transcriptional regulator [Micromonospora craniellae]
MASPTARRKLGIELRGLREAAGLNIEQAAGTAGISDSHLSRIERGRVGVRPLTLKALLQHYGADAEVTERLAKTAADTTKRGDRGWWQPYAAAISEKYASLIAFESEASSVRAFGPMIVPGLLQTEDYARALLQRGPVRLKADEIDTRVEVRTARQAILEQTDPPSLWVILDEGVIRRMVGGPKVMRRQLLHLVDVATRPTVDLQVIAHSTGAHAGTLGPLVILGFPEGEDVVYCETYAGDLYPEAVASYGDVFNRLAQDAASTDRSIEMLRSAAEEMT